MESIFSLNFYDNFIWMKSMLPILLQYNNIHPQYTFTCYASNIFNFIKNVESFDITCKYIQNQIAAFINTFLGIVCYVNIKWRKGEITIPILHHITQTIIISPKNLISPKCFDSNLG